MTYFYHSVVDSPHLPRDLEHDSTHSILVSLLGEFWPNNPAVAVPSAGIVKLLAEIGASEVSTRAALSRLSRKGTLVQSKAGRNTSYALADEVASSIPASEVLTMSFGESERAWNGEWTIIVFSVPESQRDLRQLLREWLRWLGFGPVRDGVWLSPHADVALTQKSLDGLLPADGLVFKSAHVTGELNPFDVWPLAEMRTIYETFIQELRPIVYDLRAGAVAPADALRIVVSLLGRWRGFPTVDPDLPRESLPVDWPRREARRLFVEVYDACIPLAAMHVRSVISRFDPATADMVRGLSVAKSLEHYRAQVAITEVEPDLSLVGPRLPHPTY